MTRDNAAPDAECDLFSQPITPDELQRALDDCSGAEPSLSVLYIAAERAVVGLTALAGERDFYRRTLTEIADAPMSSKEALASHAREALNRKFGND